MQIVISTPNNQKSTNKLESGKARQQQEMVKYIQSLEQENQHLKNLMAKRGMIGVGGGS